MRDGWSTTALGELLLLKRGRLGEQTSEPPVLSVTKYDGIVLADDYFDKRIASRNLTQYKVVDPGDFAYSTIHIDEGSIARNNLGCTGVVSPMYTVLEVSSERVDPQYLELALRTPAMLQTYFAHAAGTVNRRRSLGFTRFAEIQIELPPISEQRWIVDLISSVDAAIEAVETYRDAAARYRTGLLDELLQPQEGWVETTLGDIAEFLNGYPFKPMDFTDTGLPVIRIKQLLNPDVSPDRFDGDLGDRFKLSDGDLVFSWSGTLAVIEWRRGDAWLNQHLFRVVPNTSIDQGFLRYVLDHSIGSLSLKTHGTTMKHITKTDLTAFRINLPPLSEQRRIVDVVSSVDAVLDAASGELDRLRELRRNLLGDLLSGDHEIPDSYDRLLEVAS